MFIKLNYHECVALIKLIEEIGLEELTVKERKAYDKLKLIQSAQKIKYETRDAREKIA
jgi:hypothetical protein